MTIDQLWITVNARRVWRGKEPVTLRHVQRALRLMLAPAPRPARHWSFSKKSAAPKLPRRWDIPAEGYYRYRRHGR